MKRLAIWLTEPVDTTVWLLMLITLAAAVMGAAVGMSVQMHIMHMYIDDVVGR